jgi:hypothetical protein
MIDPTIQALIASAEANASASPDEHRLLNQEPDDSAHAAEKLRDAQVAGFEPEFSPHEAEAAGAFQEDALDEADARETDPAWTRFRAALLLPKP